MKRKNYMMFRIRKKLIKINLEIKEAQKAYNHFKLIKIFMQ